MAINLINATTICEQCRTPFQPFWEPCQTCAAEEELSTEHWAAQLDQDEDYIAAECSAEAQNMGLMLTALSILD